MVTHAIEGFKLTVDRGPNWLFIQLRPNKNFAADVMQVADFMQGTKRGICRSVGKDQEGDEE